MTQTWSTAEQARPARPLEPRTLIVLIAGFGAVVLAAVMMLLPVPYVIYRPGPVLNTLGEARGHKLIQVTGRTTYPTTGQLDLTTVSVSGGPGHPVTLPDVVVGWLNGRTTVLPRDEVFPKGVTEQQTDEANKQEMVTSQESATAAALTTLGIRFRTELAIAGVAPTAPANGKLTFGDVITAVDGTPVDDFKTLSAVLQQKKAPAPVRISGTREGKAFEVTTGTTTGDDGRTVLGVFVDPHFTFPFPVKIQIDDIGGPSAGTMFALGIIDTLTPGSLTGGKRIAGTGTIDAYGEVGPIGGIQQKLAGARDAGARYFLAPQDNCDEVRGHVPDGLSVFRIGTLDQAETAVKGIAAGRTDGLPTC